MEVAFHRQRVKERLRVLIILIISAALVIFSAKYGIHSLIFFAMGLGIGGVFASFIGLWSILISGFWFWFLHIGFKSSWFPLDVQVNTIIGLGIGIPVGLILKAYIR